MSPIPPTPPTPSSQTPPPPPKALLFDIGGVCVLSPFAAILSYEHSLHIPPGYINFAISASKPNGAWHRMERGELVLGPEFYELFKRDLGDEGRWGEWCARSARKREEGRGEGRGVEGYKTPKMPEIDTEYLLNAILTISRTPDPHMYPALKRLKACGRFTLAALSNTMALPEGHFAAESESGADDVRKIFEPFVSSAHTRVRKPEWAAYELAFKKMNEVRKERGESALEPGEVLFLDDIGENLRVGRRFGFRTLKVNLGDTMGAVRELETLVGVRLVEEREEGGGGAKL